MNERLRQIPSVERVLQSAGDVGLPRAIMADLVRDELEAARRKASIPALEEIVQHVRKEAARISRSRLQAVINGAGIPLHTNLGRSPLSPAASEAVREAASSFSNLEFDLETGRRGARAAYLERLLAKICGAEAATVVNNCAAALVLILRRFTRLKTGVLLSRGELVQIGGGFRIPEILEASGARLQEVGTTNRTNLEDYRNAVTPETALILKVHQSNFAMDGFVESVPLAKLAGLAHEMGLPLVEDLGSGALARTEAMPGLAHEPTPWESLRAGADLVCFSGDKLFGGPQAGIICGKRAEIEALKREPFFRALRCGKLVFAALQATAEYYLNASHPLPGTHASRPRLLQMLAFTPEELRARAEAVAAELISGGVQAVVSDAQGEVGGGALPQSKLDSVTVDLVPPNERPEQLSARLRQGRPPIVAYISEGRVRIDLRTVFPEQDQLLAELIAERFLPSAET